MKATFAKKRKMKLTKKQSGLIWNMEVLCRRSIRGAYYFNVLPTKSKDRRWAVESFGSLANGNAGIERNDGYNLGLA